jgi:hypothetical protein
MRERRREEMRALEAVATGRLVSKPSFLQTEISWTSHPFDEAEFSAPTDDQTSPDSPHEAPDELKCQTTAGGPGGLICCEDCAARYCQYLSSTCNELSSERITRLESDTKEILDFLADSKQRLGQSVIASRIKKRP